MVTHVHYPINADVISHNVTSLLFYLTITHFFVLLQVRNGFDGLITKWFDNIVLCLIVSLLQNAFYLLNSVTGSASLHRMPQLLIQI